MYDFVSNWIVVPWEKGKKNSGLSQVSRISYWWGFAVGVKGGAKVAGMYRLPLHKMDLKDTGLSDGRDFPLKTLKETGQKYRALARVC